MYYSFTVPVLATDRDDKQGDTIARFVRPLRGLQATVCCQTGKRVPSELLDSNAAQVGTYATGAFALRVSLEHASVR